MLVALLAIAAALGLDCAEQHHVVRGGTPDRLHRAADAFMEPAVTEAGRLPHWEDHFAGTRSTLASTPAAPPAWPRPVLVARAQPRNWLVSADGTLNTGVGIYDDCTGRTRLTRRSAAVDGCVTGRTYFVGHNPGVFAPLMDLSIGAILTWYDSGGVPHRLRILAVRRWQRSAGIPTLLNGAVAQFQACITADGSLERILDATPA